MEPRRMMSVTPITISSAAGMTHSLSFTDAAGGVETISLHNASATVSFTADTTLSVSKSGKGAVTGSNLQIDSITLTGTTRASSLSITGNAKLPVTVNGITDASPLGSINAPSAILSGDINLDGVNSIRSLGLTAAVVTVGSATAGHFSLITGAVSTTSLTSSIPVSAITATSWTGASTLGAPSFGTLRVSGSIDDATIHIRGSGTGLANLGQLIAGNMTGALIYAGKAVSITTPLAPVGVLTGTIGSVSLTGRGGYQYVNSSILAENLNHVSLGNVQTDNSASGNAAFGLYAAKYQSVTGIFSGKRLKTTPANLTSNANIAASVTQQKLSFGDFAIVDSAG
jgi:hypothetical protein